jgi:hypothetical protein
MQLLLLLLHCYLNLFWGGRRYRVPNPWKPEQAQAEEEIAPHLYTEKVRV